MAEYSTILEGKVWEDQVLSISKCTIVVRRLTTTIGKGWATKAGVSRICCHTSRSMNISMIPQNMHLTTIFLWKPPTTLIFMGSMDLSTQASAHEECHKNGNGSQRVRSSGREREVQRMGGVETISVSSTLSALSTEALAMQMGQGAMR
jgi:hypothetical protein